MNSARAVMPLPCTGSSMMPAVGHEKRDLHGRFELADGGTIFLDEIGEIPLDVQAKLLRVLQEREIDRVGGSKAIMVDMRVIAATHRDLVAAITAKTFREDLFYRLNVFPVMLPSLRQRREDIPLIANFLLQKFAPRIGRRVENFTPESMTRLQAYHWPGNIRELENIIERAIILADGPSIAIDATTLPATTATEPSSALPASAPATPPIPVSNTSSARIFAQCWNRPVG